MIPPLAATVVSRSAPSSRIIPGCPDAAGGDDVLAGRLPASKTDRPFYFATPAAASRSLRAHTHAHSHPLGINARVRVTRTE